MFSPNYDSRDNKRTSESYNDRLLPFPLCVLARFSFSFYIHVFSILYRRYICYFNLKSGKNITVIIQHTERMI